MAAWGTEEYARLVDLCARYLRVPSGTDDGTLTFDPPLTAEETTLLAVLGRMARSAITGLSPEEFAALDGDLAALRTFRQQTQAEFMALTATQRDRSLFDVVNAQTNVLRALLRD